MAVHNMYMNAINNFGNDKQKEEFLQPFTNGKSIGSFSLSEPGIYNRPEKIFYYTFAFCCIAFDI